MPPGVAEAFLAAVFEVRIDGERWTVAPVGADDEARVGFPAGLAAVAVVSARNPGGRPGDRDADDDAHARLAATLAARGLPPRAALGRSPDHDWTEPSHAVGLTADDTHRLDELLDLARSHRQAAIAVWTPGTLHTVWLPSGSPTTSDRRRARATLDGS